MNARLALLAVAAAVLVLAPSVQAYAKPQFYFLKDGADAVTVQDPGLPPLPVPVPVAVPILTVSGSAILNPYNYSAPNFPNSTTAHERLLLPGEDQAMPLQFLTPANNSHPDHLRGPIIIALWNGQSATVRGNVSATLYEIPASGDPKPLANATMSLDVNASKVNVTALVPPNATDPVSTALYEMYELEPVLLNAPLTVVMPVDVDVANDSQLALGVRLDAGSSPLPVGAGTATIAYDSLYTPSYVYVPWYAQDPAKPVPTKAPTPVGGSSSGSPYTYGGGYDSSSSSSASKGSSKGSPGPEMAFVAIAIAGLAVALRRRL